MAGTFSTIARNQALDGITVDRVSLHSGDPGTTGANYITAGGKQAATFDAGGTQAVGERRLTGDIAFTGMTASQSVTHFGFWLAAGDVFKGGVALTGDQAANAAGEYTLKATTSKITA
jgi:hypothetical protein